MNDVVFNFRHPYYKLMLGTFTTIRGKAKYKQLTVGQVVAVETPVTAFNARVTALELARVADMTLAFLKADAEYPGCTITRREHFIRLLNSFRAPCWAQVTLESELTIITLARLTG